MKHLFKILVVMFLVGVLTLETGYYYSKVQDEYEEIKGEAYKEYVLTKESAIVIEDIKIERRVGDPIDACVMHVSRIGKHRAYLILEATVTNNGVQAEAAPELLAVSSDGKYDTGIYQMFDYYEVSMENYQKYEVIPPGATATVKYLLAIGSDEQNMNVDIEIIYRDTDKVYSEHTINVSDLFAK